MTEQENKPDFALIEIGTTHSENNAFERGCDHVWSTYVVPLQEENRRLQNRIESLENIADMDRKTEHQYNQLYKEKEALRDEVERCLKALEQLANHGKNLSDEVERLTEQIQKLSFVKCDYCGHEKDLNV